MPNFNIRDDNEKIKTEQYFWCSGHLGAIPISERSPDSRYCNFCYDLLNNEVKVLKETHQFKKDAKWIPKKDGLPKAHGEVLLPTNSTSNKTPARSTGGRPRQTLPMDKILELHNEGVGVKAIGRQLGFSGMTVSRALAGVK